ncbi:4-hydroxy-3-methylbut-2-enyl diphosphate reductase [Desulfopila aestuarii]|uniref:4-hydroxy-3-methylbut-2-enyl diphosphate reductase n=1 Tax=Desulfopila aestuarii DSM 18488 TaxID=1121416 RepID=A0A1M7Y170_9BACT|nr:4-hydroxy-3-methylbut-2-enyl diphosphate reductase [Desulfopila aestuarii]SHO45408.1 4-hydroxy-3-methylbut-2-enyl diphosphate reductase [Desulfopila aestuarii DSM 18488]
MAQKFQIILASPRGFCAGVERAIETVKKAIRDHGSPVYVLHEIVHNKHVLQELESLGAIFVERLQEIPRGGICIFSAHGVSVETEAIAARLGLRTIDATCPLVSSVHRMVEKYHQEKCDVIIIGHHRHPEVEGTAGRVPDGVHIVATVDEARTVTLNDNDMVAYVTQTTLSREDIVGIQQVLLERFPKLRGPKSNICFATENRQNAVRALAEMTDIIFVVGSKNSSNSNRLREVSLKSGTIAFLIDDYSDIDPDSIVGVNRVGITAGASAPERLVRGVVEYLRKHGAGEVLTLEGLEESVHFSPASL